MTESKELGSSANEVIKTLYSLPFALHNGPSRVLYIPELVDNVFSFLGRADNARNARVCKVWSDHALRFVWMEVDDLHAIFSVLVPMVDANPVPQPVEFYRLAYLPSASDWKRFERYARHVRKLYYHQDYRKKVITRSALRDVSYSRIRLEIFPNMHTLVWRPADMEIDPDTLTLDDALIFMHSRITKFNFSLSQSMDLVKLDRFLTDVPQRMPSLTDVAVYTAIPLSVSEGVIHAFLKDLSSLKNISLPGHYLSTRLAEVLSALPDLQSIVTGYPDQISNHQPVEDFALSPRAGRFDALERLGLTMNIPHVRTLINHLRKDTLSILCSRSGDIRPRDIRSLFVTLAEKQKCSKTIIVYSHGNFMPYDAPETESEFLTPEIMLPLADLSRLTVLKIQHPWPLTLTSLAITSLLKTLPNLQTLSLNPSPRRHKSATLALDVLPVIARHCSHLETLGIFIDATLPMDYSALPMVPATTPFRKLKSLHIGMSVISKETTSSVALFLSDILPRSCEVSAGAWWHNEIKRRGGESWAVTSEKLKLWEAVKGLVKVIRAAVERERTRMGSI